MCASSSQNACQKAVVPDEISYNKCEEVETIGETQGQEDENGQKRDQSATRRWWKWFLIGEPGDGVMEMNRSYAFVSALKIVLQTVRLSTKPIGFASEWTIALVSYRFRWGTSFTEEDRWCESSVALIDGPPSIPIPPLRKESIDTLNTSSQREYCVAFGFDVTQ